MKGKHRVFLKMATNGAQLKGITCIHDKHPVHFTHTGLFTVPDHTCQHEAGPGGGDVTNMTDLTTIPVWFRREGFPHERIRRAIIYSRTELRKVSSNNKLDILSRVPATLYGEHACHEV